MSQDDTAESELYKKYIRDVPDFPKPGISFKDIAPLLQDGEVFRKVVRRIASAVTDLGLRPELVACPEARGFIFGSALAYELGTGFVPIRKPGKLPFQTTGVDYALEYGTDRVEMHVDAVHPGSAVLLVDDLLATGGTIGACSELIRKNEGQLVGSAFLVELTFLEGRSRLPDAPSFSLIRY